MVVWTSFVFFSPDMKTSWLSTFFLSGQTYKYKRVGVGELVMDELDNLHDTTSNLFSCVTVIVRANPQHHDLEQQRRQKTTGWAHATESLVSWYLEVGNGAQAVFCEQRQASSCSLYLAKFSTFGLMLSSSPLLSLHSTCCVASPPIPKLRQWRGENNCRHTCRKHMGISQNRPAFFFFLLYVSWLTVISGTQV